MKGARGYSILSSPISLVARSGGGSGLCPDKLLATNELGGKQSRGCSTMPPASNELSGKLDRVKEEALPSFQEKLLSMNELGVMPDRAAESTTWHPPTPAK